MQHFDKANGAMMQIFVDNIRRWSKHGGLHQQHSEVSSSLDIALPPLPAGAVSENGEQQEIVDKEMQRLKYFTRQLPFDKDKKIA